MATPKRPPPCGCGAKDKCEPRSPAVRHYPDAPGRDNPATHWATEGGLEGVTSRYGDYTAWRLWSCLTLLERDGAGSPWHAEYWRWWERRQHG